MVVRGAVWMRGGGYTMRLVVPVLAVLALVSCGPRVPDSAGGQDYNSYIRNAAPGSSSSSATVDGLDPNRPRGGAAPEGIAPVQSELEFQDKSAISQEQNFAAVKSARSIEADKELLAQQRAQYQVIQPSALPARPGNDGPNLAEYALSTTNAVGEKIYTRFSIIGGDPARACARYTSPDLAQMAFLNSGGPQRDPKGLDPDGDGFACDWDPAPFRAAAR